MSEPGDQRLPSTMGPPDEPGRGWRDAHGHDSRESHRGRASGRAPVRSLAAALVLACGVALLAAAGWAVLRGILGLGPSSLLVAVLGGWGIGSALRQSAAPAPSAAPALSAAPAPSAVPAMLAGLLGMMAWLLGLVLSWLLAMAILPGSARTYLERLEGTPFLGWLAPQSGLLEIAGLLLYAGVAAYTARPSARSRT